MARGLHQHLAGVALLGILHPGPAAAVTVIIGDPDGFGISPTGGLVRADGAHSNPADVDGDGILEPGEYLPDWNANGSCAIGSADSFDNREAAELADTIGAQWTDYAVEGSGAADGLQLVFTFPVPASTDGDFGTGHFVNFVFGDYDVTPAEVDIDGLTVPMEVQAAADDGLVQSTFAGVPWESMTDGEVVITLSAPDEPYLAFDYALLDTVRIADQDGDGIPGSIDNCPGTPNLDQADGDGDGVGDACDLCPDDPNPDQSDADGDLAGDACDPCPGDATDDGDADGWCAPEDCAPLDPAVHPGVAELCNGVDDDCDGLAPQEEDDDGDGVRLCDGDCDDSNPDASQPGDAGCGDDDDSADDDSAGDDDSLEDTTGGGENPDWGDGCACGAGPARAGAGAELAWLALGLVAVGRRRR